MSSLDIPKLVSDLQSRVNDAADMKTKTWFENYLKHAIRYRGVKTPEVAKILAEWRKFHGLHQCPETEQLNLALSLIREEHAEDKFAGTIYIQEYLLKRISADSLLANAENLFSSGAFFDWSTTDWFCVRVLGPAIVRHGQQAAERIASWRRKSNLWNRRASIVPFRAVVHDEDYHHLIRSTVAILIKEEERFIQTGIGWVISDLSKLYPDTAAELVELHFNDLSDEVIKRHTKYLSNHDRYKARKRPSK